MIAYGDAHQIDFISFFVEAIQSVRPDFSGPPMDPPPLPRIELISRSTVSSTGR